MSGSNRSAAAAALLLAWVAACDPVGPDDRQLGYLGDSGIGFMITVPDTVSVGRQFDVTIAVYGSSSCTSVEQVDVEYTALGATLRPFVRTKSGICTADLRQFNATGQVALFRRGLAQINIRGRYGAIDAMGRHEERDTTVVRRTFVR